MKCINCSSLIEYENIEGTEFAFWCEYLGIEIEDPAEEGCEVYQ